LGKWQAITDGIVKKVRDDMAGRQRTYNQYNLDIMRDTFHMPNFFEMPILEPTDYVPEALIGFNECKSKGSASDKCVHFFLDDYQFERVWRVPSSYVNMLSKFGGVLTPDFSLYMDMTQPMKIWNTYRNRLIGAYMQAQGLNVIPTVSWAEEETFAYCFDGLPSESVVAISTIGVRASKMTTHYWMQGVDELIKRLHPSMILVYGGRVDYDFGDTKVKYFENERIKRFDEMREREG